MLGVLVGLAGNGLGDGRAGNSRLLKYRINHVKRQATGRQKRGGQTPLLTIPNSFTSPSANSLSAYAWTGEEAILTLIA